MSKPKKVLVLGSGSLKIGEAGEFDYSGSQCLKTYREEGIKTVLINPNIATIQTSKGMADKIYFLPVTPFFVEKVIEKEQPDAIALSFGGQTALNCGVALHDKGILKKHKIRVLGTPVKSIKMTEDRQLFAQELRKIKVDTPESKAVHSTKQGLAVAKKIQYPVMARVAYALGGAGSGIAKSPKELTKLLNRAFSISKQVLIEKYLGGWKEVEYEVVRDTYDNCITVCNMENFDPLGIHTGESIVVAPSQTLTNHEYHKLRAISTKVVRHLGIIGECNIQFALNPHSEEYRVIEVNARLSRSSALASKATGYPLALIAAKLGLGYALHELPNNVTKVTKSCFEPALDYIVVKIPRWDLEKFKQVSLEIGSEMKSVGEVMAIGRSFEEALQKALRMLGNGLHGLVCNTVPLNKNITAELTQPTDKRIIAIAEAFRKNYSVKKIHSLSKIDPWFLYKLQHIVKLEQQISKQKIASIWPELLREAKEAGYSDFQIARLLFSKGDYTQNLLSVRKLRKKFGIVPVVRQIDTLAAEYPAKTNYLYLTYHGIASDVTKKNRRSVVVLGSGAYRIGSSVEFDWCCVNAIKALQKKRYKTVMINFNPETVSTDYDMCDRLYFDELTLERVLDIYEHERPQGVVVSMGGQIPNNLAIRLHKNNVPVLGTSPEDIDRAENRHKFSQLCDQLKIDQPQWIEASSIKAAQVFAEKVSYPVLIRPSYVLSGAAMSVAFSAKELQTYLEKATTVSKEFPVVVSKFISGAKEIEIDAVAKNGRIIIYAISEHVENAGVHSGDATLVLPPQFTYLETIRRIKIVAKKIAEALSITGPFNMQFLAKQNRIKVIECNLRSSRSFPFVSKVLKHNFITIATNAMLGEAPKQRFNTLDLDYVGVKAPQFSFSRLHGADPVLSVEMASTGEVGCLGKNIHAAFLKSLLSVGFTIPKKHILLSTGTIKNKMDLLEGVRQLKQLGFTLYATQGTHMFLQEQGIPTIPVHWPLENKEPNALTLIQKGKIDMIINIPKSSEDTELENDYLIRRKSVDFNIPLLTDPQHTKLFIESMHRLSVDDLEIKSWDEYDANS